MLDPKEVSGSIKQHAKDGTLLTDGIQNVGEKIYAAYSEQMSSDTDKTQLNEDLSKIILPYAQQLQTMGGNTFGVIQVGDELAKKLEAFVEEKNSELDTSPRPY
jgi:hypothetical protein